MRRNTMATVRQAKVLLVDPHSLELERTASGLRQLGFRVVAVSRLDALVPLFRAFSPEAVVIAAQAPHFESIELVRRLKRLEGPGTPFLFLVDAPDPALRLHCLSKGVAVDALARPADVAELGAKLSALLHWREGVVRQSREEGEEPTPTLHDAETGLFKRSYLLSVIGHELRRAHRYGGSVTVCVGTAQAVASPGQGGRLVAPRALMEVASALTGSALRELDVLARVGPRSFGILMPDLDSDHVPEVMDRLHQRLSHLRVDTGSAVVPLRIQLGTATFPDVLGPPQVLLNRAQAARTLVRPQRLAEGTQVWAPRMSAHEPVGR